MAKAKDRHYVRNARGGGVIFKSKEEADNWVKANPGYESVTRDAIDADQASADAEVEAKAQAKSEDKAVAAPNRARG